MSDDIQGSKAAIAEVKNRVDDVDLKSRKGVAELSDKIEVERVVADMVGWVADRQRY